jgi:hypothetical protein
VAHQDRIALYFGYICTVGVAINGGMVISEMMAVKAAFDLFRSAKAALLDAVDLLPDGKQKEEATQTLEEAAGAAIIAEATIAQALGYELCRCEFPPITMLKVGFLDMRDGTRDIKDVYECPKCKQNTAGAWAFNRKTGE